MSMPYISYVRPGVPSTYSFSTNQGKAARVTIPTALDLSSYAMTLEVDRISTFLNAKPSGTAMFNGTEIVINLSSSEVDALKDGFYRIMAMRGSQAYILVEGKIDWNPRPKDDDGLLDGDGEVRTEFVEPLNRALEGQFLRRDEYVAGVVDPAVLNQAVDTKLSAHVNSATPHPAYDIDMQDLAVLFENRLF